MASESVHPLRITKTTPSGSPTKMSAPMPRALAEISPMEKRRNSPSWHQPATSPKKPGLETDSSPFQSSPPETAASPRMFWQNRNTENLLFGGQVGSPSPNRRSSIERLQRASRVKNSNILALEQKQEYDPTRLPQIERPLAKVQGNAFRVSNSSLLRSSDCSLHTAPEFNSSTSSSITAMMSPKSSISSNGNPPQTPTKDQPSPTKSSLSPSKFKSSFDHDLGSWSANSSMQEHDLANRSLHRHAKSVTFDAAPPQINEYEMATPDLSSIGSNSREGSYESVEYDEDDSILYDPAHISGHEDSFDASLEDTDKTPVVGPDDWRGESPLVQSQRRHEEWEQSPAPEAPLATPNRPSSSLSRTGSTTSNGDHRPLPPLPGMGHARNQSASSVPSAPTSPGLSATAERLLGANRSLPSPPPASTSKADIHNIGNKKMTLEERLRLMMLSEDNGGKSAAEQQRERRLRRANGRERFGSPNSEADSTISNLEAAEEDDTVADISLLEDYQLPSRISRESIMRRVNGNKTNERESDWNFSSPAPSSPQRSPARSPERQMSLDPDVPIPSTEDSMLSEINEEEEEGSVIITRDPAHDDESEREDSIEYRQPSEDLSSDGRRPQQSDDDGSHYSDQVEASQKEVETKPLEEEVLTPRASSPIPALAPVPKTNPLDSIPNLGPSTRLSAFSRDFESYMLPSKTAEEDKENQPEEAKPAPRLSDARAYLQRPYTPEQIMSKPEYDGSGWGEPDDEYGDEPGTPESVIHHPMPDDESEAEVEEELTPKKPEPPVIPEKMATIKASGSKLKTRVSNTPSDLAAMREARRQVSHEIPIVPPIPEKHRNRLSRDMSEAEPSGDDFLERHPSFKNRSLTLDLDLGLSLDQDFERVIESQKVALNQPISTGTYGALPTGEVEQVSRFAPFYQQGRYANIHSPRQRGYLMRQNTKLVSASDKDRDESWKARSAGNSPVKQQRPQSWTVEPWNGKTRQGSGRKRSGTGPALTSGPVPPMPGYQSNATALNQVVEEEDHPEVAPPESGERGRLFVKVMGVKDLDLPLPKNERTWFSLTLDNGVHCVTTAWLELARNAPIGQEFELVVPNDLEFQLTLNVKLDKPAPIKLNAPSAKATKTKTSTFSRLLASPKKRKELEIRQREEEERHAQQQRDAQARQRNTAPTAYELLSPLAAEDGSFARSYVCLKEHESRCFGRPYMAEIACFNEWAVEEADFASSVKSKRGNTAVVRRAPYKVGKLELQLVFVPRPKSVTDDDMPKSMNSCIRELKAAEERLSRNWEGHLSQQGGDCPYWRRRYFKLVGTKLTAYHEATRQPRATINLSNAKRLIDDRRALTEKETLGRGGKRRRSAFAEEEEGYMFVEEGFRIRFNNGEVIDFYADTAEDKEGWMSVLNDVMGRGDSGVDEDGPGPRSRAKWCEIVLKREEQLRRRSEARRIHSHSRTKSMYL